MAPGPHLGPGDTDPIEQQAQAVLGVGLDRAATVRVAAQRVPFRVGHHLIEPGQHDHALRQPCDTVQQPRDRRRRDRDAGRDDQPLGRMRGPALRRRGEQAVASLRQIDKPAPAQLLGPARQHDAQDLQRRLPMFGQFGRHRIGQPRR